MKITPPDVIATLFSNNDLTEPGFGGQVIATSSINQGFIPDKIKGERRQFQRVLDQYQNLSWRDQHGYAYSWSDLRDIVIINRGSHV
jgi:hypothetical protein